MRMKGCFEMDWSMKILKDKRWKWLKNKEVPEKAKFVYGVIASKIYFDPHNPSRLPKPENIVFFDNENDAILAGYRKSKRCGDIQKNTKNRHCKIIKKACEIMDNSDGKIKLDELADTVGMSAYHFHRVFKEQTGVTPKEYLQTKNRNQVQQNISTHDSITAAVYDSGFSSNSRFYEKSNQLLGMTPKKFKSGGKNEVIYFSIGKCSLGSFLVAKSAKGLCRISINNDPEVLIKELQDAFSHAELIGGDAEFDLIVAKVVGLIEHPGNDTELPLDIRGTAFQQKVWKALREIPAGETVTYSYIAQKIGMPKSYRAVANACGANKLAVAVPCHRVVRNDGSLGGYRWGLDRKKVLINREKEQHRIIGKKGN